MCIIRANDSQWEELFLRSMQVNWMLHVGIDYWNNLIGVWSGYWLHCSAKVWQNRIFWGIEMWQTRRKDLNETNIMLDSHAYTYANAIHSVWGSTSLIIAHLSLSFRGDFHHWQIFSIKSRVPLPTHNHWNTVHDVQSAHQSPDNRCVRLRELLTPYWQTLSDISQLVQMWGAMLQLPLSLHSGSRTASTTPTLRLYLHHELYNEFMTRFECLLNRIIEFGVEFWQLIPT